MITEEQRKERMGYIGGSDAAAVLGLSRWATPLSVWAVKTGQVAEPDISGKLQVKLGIRLEETVAELFTEETGKKVRRVNKTLFHPKYSFLGANIDRDVLGEDALLECKTASAWKAKEWEGEEIPREYIIQVMHYLAVTGVQRGYIACLIGNQDFKWKMVERDEKALANLVERERAFWHDFVLPVVMPATFSPHDKDTLDQLFPQAEDEKAIQLGDEAARQIEMLEGLEADGRDIENKVETIKNELRAALGTAEMGMTAHHKVFWTNAKMRRFDIDAFTKAHPYLYEEFRREKLSRRFLIKELTPQKGA